MGEKKLRAILSGRYRPEEVELQVAAFRAYAGPDEEQPIRIGDELEIEGLVPVGAKVKLFCGGDTPLPGIYFENTEGQRVYANVSRDLIRRKR